MTFTTILRDLSLHLNTWHTHGFLWFLAWPSPKFALPSTFVAFPIPFYHSSYVSSFLVTHIVTHYVCSLCLYRYFAGSPFIWFCICFWFILYHLALLILLVEWTGPFRHTAFALVPFPHPHIVTLLYFILCHVRFIFYPTFPHLPPILPFWFNFFPTTTITVPSFRLGLPHLPTTTPYLTTYHSFLLPTWQDTLTAFFTACWHLPCHCLPLRFTHCVVRSFYTDDTVLPLLSVLFCQFLVYSAAFSSANEHLFYLHAFCLLRGAHFWFLQYFLPYFAFAYACCCHHCAWWWCVASLPLFVHLSLSLLPHPFCYVYLLPYHLVLSCLLPPFVLPLLTFTFSGRFMPFCTHVLVHYYHYHLVPHLG